MLTLHQAAEAAAVRPQTLYRTTKEGRLPYILKYGKKLVTPGALQLYIDSLGLRNGHRTKTGQTEPER